MGITFEKQRYYGPLQCKCLMSMSDLLSVIQITAVSIITGSVNIYCLCVLCVISNQTRNKNHAICVKSQLT